MALDDEMAAVTGVDVQRAVPGAALARGGHGLADECPRLGREHRAGRTRLRFLGRPAVEPLPPAVPEGHVSIEIGDDHRPPRLAAEARLLLHPLLPPPAS